MRNPENVRKALLSRDLLHIAVEIARKHHVSLDDMLSSVRRKTVVDARRELYMALRLMNMSLPEIGAILNCDHTSVLAGLRPRGCKKAGYAPSTMPDALRAANNESQSADWALSGGTVGVCQPSTKRCAG